MHKAVGLLWIAGFFGLLAVADAQTPSPPAATTQFDGTYAFVSQTKVNETYAMRDTNHILPCPDIPRVTRLTVLQGQAQYSATSRYQQLNEGIVGTQGELSMRVLPTAGARGAGGDTGFEIMTWGRIDGNGTVHARRMGSCSYDLVWQKIKVQSTSFPIPSTQFDGTYTFVSSTKANEIYMNGATGRRDQCPERGEGTLTIINGQAHLKDFEGAVGSHGELAMLRVRPDAGMVNGTIEKDGTVKARRTIGDCGYDTIWRKESE